MGNHVIRRKHTVNAKRMLPGLLMEIIEPLAIKREEQAKKFDHYKHTMLSCEAADHFIMELYRRQVIGVQKIADVNREWERPSFDEFKHDLSAWRMFNAVTYALDGRVAENPAATADLHRLLDLTCEHVS